MKLVRGFFLGNAVSPGILPVAAYCPGSNPVRCM